MDLVSLFWSYKILIFSWLEDTLTSYKLETSLFNNLLNEESENIKNNIFYITDDENKFKKNLLDFIKIDSPNIKKIYLK